MKMKIILIVSLFSISMPLQADELLDLLQGKTSPTATAPSGDVYGHGKDSFKILVNSELPQLTAEQNILASFFNKDEMNKVLFQWPSAFDGTAFQNTATSKALYSYILFVNGMPVIGVENLFKISNPEKISKDVIALWKENLTPSNISWSLADIQWSPYWTEVFDTATEVLVMSRQNFKTSDIEKVKELLTKSAPDTRERNLLEWQLVLALSMNDQAPQAAQILAHLVKSKSNPIGTDLTNIIAARLLFQNGYLDAAIQYYQKIDKSTDYWFDAQEEMAWSYIRKGEPQNTLAVTKTLVNKSFANQIGPETVFLQAVAQLKVCDYPAVLTSLSEYKDRFKPRAKLLKSIVEETSSSAAIAKYIATAKNKVPTMKDLGPELKDLPRFITRDARLNELIRLEKQIDIEKDIADKLYGNSLAEGTGKVGFQAKLDEYRSIADQRRQAIHSTILTKIKSLADLELVEISKNLQKMQIVEAEFLQQISIANRIVKTDMDKIIEKKGSTGSQGRDKLVFVAEDEVWFDELTNYKVDIRKACQKTH